MKIGIKSRFLNIQFAGILG